MLGPFFARDLEMLSYARLPVTKFMIKEMTANRISR